MSSKTCLSCLKTFALHSAQKFCPICEDEFPVKNPSYKKTHHTIHFCLLCNQKTSSDVSKMCKCDEKYFFSLYIDAID